MKTCIECNLELTGRQVKFCSKQCKMKNCGNSYPAQKRRAIERKLYLIKKMGGQCRECGYKKNISSLSFHHLDPNIKETSLDSRKLSNMTLERINAESDKCVLVCHNCHNELHHPHLNDLI